jgi:hypothetical protein
MIHQDKNNAVCVKCEKRVRYVASLEAAMGYPAASAEDSAASPLHGPARIFT